MPATPAGPDFERSPDQRVIPGGYEAPSPPVIPSTTMTLMDRLRLAIKRPSTRRKGPGFTKPKAWGRWPEIRRVVKKTTSRRRPSNYEFPGGNTPA